MKFNTLVINDIAEATFGKGNAKDIEYFNIIFEVLNKDNVVAKDLERFGKACNHLSLEEKVAIYKKSKFFRMTRTLATDAWTGKTTSKEIRNLLKYRILVK